MTRVSPLAIHEAGHISISSVFDGVIHIRRLDDGGAEVTTDSPDRSAEQVTLSALAGVAAERYWQLGYTAASAMLRATPRTFVSTPHVSEADQVILDRLSPGDLRESGEFVLQLLAAGPDLAVLAAGVEALLPRATVPMPVSALVEIARERTAARGLH